MKKSICLPLHSIKLRTGVAAGQKQCGCEAAGWGYDCYDAKGNFKKTVYSILDKIAFARQNC